MKIKQDFVLRQVAGTYVVLPIGRATVDFNGMVTLNETGAFLWRLLEQGTVRDALADALCAEYSVDRETALQDVDDFIAMLEPAGCIEK